MKKEKMTWTRHSLDLLVWSCLVLAAESQQGSVSPPQNLSLLWVSGFEPQLSWAPPQNSGADCTYNVIWKIKDDEEVVPNVTAKNKFYIVMEGGFLNMTIETVCGSNSSKPAWLSVDHPELLRNLTCYIHSATQTHCSWQPASGARGLRFFYWLLNDFTQITSETVTLQECSAYSSSGGVRTACDLDANIHQTIHILLNGTVDNTPATNTFEKKTFNDVRPPPLDWTVTKTSDKFLIKWTRPEIEGLWTYIINYTQCGKPQTDKKIVGETSMELDLDPHCAYRIAIKAIWYEHGSTTEKRGETPYSRTLYFEADTDPNAWVFAAIIIPMILAGLAALVLVCFRKNKAYILPKVPEPRDFLSDISNNNNNIKGTDHSLYVPAEESDNCEITLVVDPLINTLDL